jgi:hypothetical protein
MRDAILVASKRDALGTQPIRALALTLFLSAGAIFEALVLSSLHDPEVWRHLRVGAWILDTRAWPHSGLFSQSADLPWRDFSWGYDVLAALVYRFLGLRAVPALLMMFRVALAVVTFVLAGGRRQFWTAAALSVVVQYLLGTLGPTSEFCSVVLFGVELILIQKVRISGDCRWMYLLPPLFVLWASFDIGFVYGIVVFILFAFFSVAEPRGASAGWSWVQETRARKTVIVAGLACLAASLVNPYGYQAYPTFCRSQTDAINVNLPGYAAMGFHRPQDYLLLLLTMAAFLTLGLLRSRQLFPASLLIFCTILAFHAQRAGWLVALASLFVMGEAIPRQKTTKRQGARSWPGKLSVATACLMLLLCGVFFFVCVPANNTTLLAHVADQFPVRACDYIRQHELPRPVFNGDEWGNFLTWYLPEYPVAIDSRRGLYSEDQESDYANVMKAGMRYQDFAPMRQARTLLMEKKRVMGEALRELPDFQVAYEDAQAIVFLQQNKE